MEQARDERKRLEGFRKGLGAHSVSRKLPFGLFYRIKLLAASKAFERCNLTLNHHLHLLHARRLHEGTRDSGTALPNSWSFFGIHAGRLPGLDLPEAAEMLAEESSSLHRSFHE